MGCHMSHVVLQSVDVYSSGQAGSTPNLVSSVTWSMIMMMMVVVVVVVIVFFTEYCLGVMHEHGTLTFHVFCGLDNREE